MAATDVSVYRELFISESKEQLQSLNKSLLSLERKPENLEPLNEMFRCAHTLKGMASTMGYDSISDLSHNMENVLSMLREGGVIEKGTVDLLFECIDMLGLLIEDVVSGKAVKRNLSGLYKKLADILPRAGQVEELLPVVPKAEVGFTESEKSSIGDAKKSGLTCFKISITLSEKCLLKIARAVVLLKEIQTRGKIIKTIPSDKEIESGKFENQFDVILVTKQDPKEIKKLVEQIPEIKEAEVSAVALEKEAGKVMPTIRIGIDRLQVLQNMVEELAIAKLRLLQTASKYNIKELGDVSATIDRLTSELQERVLQMRMFPVDYIFNRFPRLVRDLGTKQKKEINFVVEGKEIELDRLVLDEISDTVLHLLRNAVDHGIESPEDRKKAKKDSKGKIELIARREGNYVVIEVRDDGRGMDLEGIKNAAVEQGIISKEESSKLSDLDVFGLLGAPGLSTTKKITDVSGRGVGFDVVKSKIKSLGGNVRVQSKMGAGTNVEMKLPLTTAIIQSLLVGVENEKYALPIGSIRQIVAPTEQDLKSIEGREMFEYREQVLPLLRLKNVLGVPGNGTKIGPVVVVEKGEKLLGLMVDSLIGQQETVVKPLEGMLKGRKEFAGATILGDGTVALILDMGGLV